MEGLVEEMLEVGRQMKGFAAEGGHGCFLEDGERGA